jgi:hypothetical protein
MTIAGIAQPSSSLKSSDGSDDTNRPQELKTGGTIGYYAITVSDNSELHWHQLSHQFGRSTYFTLSK